jgi:hypothetical protein
MRHKYLKSTPEITSECLSRSVGDSDENEGWDPRSSYNFQFTINELPNRIELRSLLLARIPQGKFLPHHPCL